MKKVITFGTYDLLHEGHIRILERAKALGDYLIVGISTDKLNASKGKMSVFPEAQRLGYVRALKCVDEVFLEESLADKDLYINKYQADLLVMGDDWDGKFDWVSCETKYLKRTEGVSSTGIKTDISERYKVRKVLFGDTYIRKHYDCALSILNDMTAANIAPIFTTTKELPSGIDCDCIIYFNKPAIEPPKEYSEKVTVLIDHGASTLKWFLASKARFDFFDRIITAGPDHANALEKFFPGNSSASKVRSAGFIKSNEIFQPPKYSRIEISEKCGLDPNKPIILFAPTWHITANKDMNKSIQEISKLDNVITSLHPETAHLNVSDLNVCENINGMTLELMKHSDCVISDTSSTLFEACALNIPTIQILLREYSDNNSKLFDFPMVAGTCDLFIGGLPVKPKDIIKQVKDVIENESVYIEFYASIRKRLLSGTNISKDATKIIVQEIIRSCEIGKVEFEKSNDQLASDGLKDVHKGMGFARNKIISHACGNYKKIHASNYLEALEQSFKAVDIVEMDVVIGEDGLLVAHDGYENRYGFTNLFKKIATLDFLKSKFNKELTTFSVDDALEIIKGTKKTIVFDIKDVAGLYEVAAIEIVEKAKLSGVLDEIVIQAYDFENFSTLVKLGVKNVILAVWKVFYRDPLGDESYSFISKCYDANQQCIVGISIPYINKHMSLPSFKDSRMERYRAFWRRIYIHGAPYGQYSELLSNNYGVFADGFSAKNEFKDMPTGFDWVQYLFLNPGLIDAGVDNQVAAVNHYLDYGMNESRKNKYDVPKDFIWSKYLEKNPDLRQGGVTSVDSAKAHWTLYGHKEGRAYLD